MDSGAALARLVHHDYHEEDGVRPVKQRKGPRRGLVLALGGVVLMVGLLLCANQIFGRAMGEPCGDSYACRGLLLRGIECVEVEDRSYCTRYCRSDRQCPPGWACLDANPTVLTVKTRALDRVCIWRP